MKCGRNFTSAMANQRYSTVQYNVNTPQVEKVPQVPIFSTARTPPPQEHTTAINKKHFTFSTSSIHFWTTGRSGNKSSEEKLPKSYADIINHGDQLRYIKEQRNILRRLAIDFFFYES